MLQDIIPLKVSVLLKSFLFQVDTLEKILYMDSRKYMYKDVHRSVVYNGRNWKQPKGPSTED